MVNTKKRKPELVSPAGNWDSATSAIAGGADAVYFGVKGINMRLRAENFDVLQIKKLMDELHDKGKKGYLALNVVVYDKEIDKIKRILEESKKAGVDAVILWDMAVLRLAKEFGHRLHLSTQASVSSYEALREYVSLGIKRIVLARECTLKDIKRISNQIKKDKVDCSIETFVHGALCVSVSGRCFLSQQVFSKSANRGECLQPCRREFVVRDKEDECEYVVGEDFILSPKDLCTITFMDKLMTAGIDAFKIEGRMRPPEYVREVTCCYREAIDAFSGGSLDEKKKKGLLKRLKQTFNRGFDSGFYFGVPQDLGGVLQNEYEKTYIGEVLKFYKKIGVAEIIVNAEGLKCGQKILVSGKKTPAEFFVIEKMEIDHKSVKTVKKGTAVGIKLPFEVKRGDKIFLWKDKK